MGRRLGTLSDKLAGLYSSTVTDEVDASTGETVILHVSDLHLNPIGLELVRRLATSFDVDAVLDTGDTTSFGSPFEGRFADLIADFPVPYLYVAGNHDSPENRAAISAAPGVESLDRRVRLGRRCPHPGVRRSGGDDDAGRPPRRARAHRGRSRALRSAVLAEDEQPDVIAVHNPVILRDVLGLAPVAVVGHLHRHALGARGGTLISVVGSTGATGLGSLLTEADLPYAASLLRFRGSELVAIDQLEVVGTAGDLVVQRRSISDEDRDGDDAGFIDTDVEEGTRPDSPTTTSAPSDRTSTTEDDPGG